LASCASFYWYDYETFGTDPGRDRPAQFAGLRTDTELHPIEDPLVLYCKPARDYLPTPEACLLTGITPQIARHRGIPEAEFIAAIHEAFSVPGTCVAGYNNLRFDDEVTRYTLYRNLFDPYAREWRNGNSRWDLIDLMRLARALRPEGIEWPVDDAERPTFRLEALTAANGIAHAEAHDALADVRATLELARLVKSRQPRLYDWVLAHRGKAQVAELLNLGKMEPVLHVSEKFPAERHCAAVVVALAKHPRNGNGVAVYDLAVDPTPLLTLDAEELRRRLYTPVADLAPGLDRPPLKTVHLNRCPIVVPLRYVRPQDQERLSLDLPRCLKHLEALKAAPEVAAKVQAILEPEPKPTEDPDLLLYAGGFLGDGDRALLNRLRSLSPAELARARPRFQDARLPEMLFRFRARNYPETLTPDEARRWEDYRVRRLTDPAGGATVVRSEYERRLRELEAVPDLTAARRAVIDSLWAYLREILP
jgi:exodeoxyribonuclease-1